VPLKPAPYTLAEEKTRTVSSTGAGRKEKVYLGARSTMPYPMKGQRRGESYFAQRLLTKITNERGKYSLAEKEEKLAEDVTLCAEKRGDKTKRKRTGTSKPPRILAEEKDTLSNHPGVNF